MTDQELIKALKCCGSDGYNCGVCPCFGECEADCGNRAPALAADRLETLLAEVKKQICKRSELDREIGRLEVQVEHLKAGKDTNVPTKWVSVEERLPEPNQMVLLIAHGWSNRTVYVGELQRIEAQKSCLTGVTSEESDWLIWGWSYLREPNVTHWQPLPEPPSTEGVE